MPPIRGQASLNQRLQNELDTTTNHVEVSTGPYCIEQLGQVRINEGHCVVLLGAL